MDGSASIAAAYANEDRRVRLVQQQNGGVAAARNRGAASTDAEFLAFVDADDLWAPSKIALQMQALVEGGPSVGLAYCWFARIDEDGRVFSSHNRPTAEGHVLQRMCRNNFVGNGSSMVVRRSAFELARQFDPSLRARNAQGCEDLLFCLRVAEHFEFRIVPQHLVGYRLTTTNMSNDVMRMLRSCEIVLAEYREKYSQFDRELDEHLIDMIHWAIVTALIGGQFDKFWPLMKRMFQLAPGIAIFHLLEILQTYGRSTLVPNWFKAPIKRILHKETAFQAFYGEINW